MMYVGCNVYFLTIMLRHISSASDEGMQLWNRYYRLEFYFRNIVDIRKENDVVPDV